MNDSLAQHWAQTPSPSTGSRQATHSVGSAMSSASLAARDQTPRQAPSAPRKWPEKERAVAISASITRSLASVGGQLNPPRIARTGRTGVPTGMASSPNLAPALFDHALLRARQSRARKLGAETFLLD